MLKYLRLQAIFAGFCVDVILTVLGSSLLLSSYGAGSFDRGMTEEQIQEQMRLLTVEPTFIMFAFLVGMACTAAGGYVAARMSRFVPLYHSACVGLLGVLLGIYVGASWGFWEILGLVFTIPVAVFGGYLAKFAR